MWDIKRFYNWSTFFEKRGMASGYHMSDWKFGSSSFSKSLVKKPSCNRKFKKYIYAIESFQVTQDDT